MHSLGRLADRSGIHVRSCLGGWLRGRSLDHGARKRNIRGYRAQTCAFLHWGGLHAAGVECTAAKERGSQTVRRGSFERSSIHAATTATSVWYLGIRSLGTLVWYLGIWYLDTLVWYLGELLSGIWVNGDAL